jgi:hypothetical protein
VFFPEVRLSRIDVARDRDFILTRLLERGTWAEVTWCRERFGDLAIRDYFRAYAHPELSRRTVRFWRVFLEEESTPWPELPEFRKRSALLWPG